MKTKQMVKTLIKRADDTVSNKSGRSNRSNKAINNNRSQSQSRNKELLKKMEEKFEEENQENNCNYNYNAQDVERIKNENPLLKKTSENGGQ